VARMTELTPWFSTYRSKGSVEKIAFFDASGLYALNRQQEVLNRILFIFSNLRCGSAILF